MPASPEQSEKALTTRASLVMVGRELFSTQGYFSTGTEQIVTRAGVTKGALYHHFADKKALFQAVFEAVNAELITSYGQVTARGGDVWQRLGKGVQFLLDQALEPQIGQITVIDSPAVLGWAAWRELVSRLCLGLFEEAIGAAIEQGIIAHQPIEPLAHILMAATSATAMLIVDSADPKATRTEVGESLDRLLDGLRLVPPITEGPTSRRAPRSW